MTDPLSIVASVAGIISLGIQVTQSLFDYYTAIKNLHSDVALTIQKLERLLTILESTQRQIDTRKFQTDEEDLRRNIEASVQRCEECIEELRAEATKFQHNSAGSLRAAAVVTARRVAYPFRQSTLQKLDEDIDEVVGHLSLALQLLQQKDIGRIQDDVEEATALLSLVRTSQISSTIREWLRAPDPTIEFNEACNKRHPRTGLWFVNGHPFTTWLQKPKSFIWLNGFCGCGKSVLCSTAIQYTFRYRRSNPQIGIAFFFFTFNDDGKQDASAMLRALVEQLSNQLGGNHTILSRLHESYRHATPPNQAIMDCLRQLLRAFRDVYIILDALDESPMDKHRAAVLQALHHLRSWSEPGLHLLVTSREVVDIRDELDAVSEETIAMKNDSIDGDIASFIHQHLRDNRQLRKWDDHYDRIETVLTARAKGVFRWVECQFKALISCPQSEDLLDQLLESLPDTLDETYERMLRNIPRASCDYARQMLTLLCGAKRPLTVSELISGIAIEMGKEPRFNAKRRLKNVDAVQQVCPGFTELDVDPDTQRSTIRIAHFSVQEYLESERICQHEGAALFSVKKQNADAQIACICLTMLLEPELLGLKDPLKIQEQYQFAQYAAQNWPNHFRDGHKKALLEDQAIKLFRDVKGSFYTWITIWNGVSPEEKKAPSPIYYASLLGLDSVLQTLLSANFLGYYSEVDTSALFASLDARSGEYGTPLQAASTGGYNKTVEVLLSNGADVNAQGNKLYGTALQAASAAGYDKTVEVLLSKGADVNAQGGDYGTALQAASARGHDKTVEVLLGKGADVNAQGDKFYGTALHAASAGGHDKTVVVLLSNGADVNAQGGDYGTALQAASARGHKKTVEVLLGKGADVNAQGDKFFGTALHAASIGGYVEIVEVLLSKGAHVNVQGGHYGTALQAASARGYDKTVEVLLSKGADVNAQGDKLYGTALHLASAGGYNKTVEVLLSKGADVNAQGGEYGTALQVSSARGYDKTVEVLLSKGADVNAQGDKLYGTALHLASAGGYNKTVEVLLSKGADVNAQGGEYGTALQVASARGYDKTVEVLLRKGADVNVQSGYHGTALQAASVGGHVEIVEVLLSKGADVNAQGGQYGTALQAASAAGYNKTVEVLLSKGADVNAQGGHFGTALQVASAAGYDKTVKILLSKGANVNAQAGYYGTALQAASAGGHDKTVVVLLSKGADVNVQGGHYGTALRAASARGHVKIVEVLRSKGASRGL